MIELPEARALSRQLRKEILGKRIREVGGNYTDHKFTFYYQDPNQYRDFLVDKTVTAVIDRNYYVELEIEDYKLVVRDGANLRFFKEPQKVPNKSKLLLQFTDGTFLNITTSMYSFISVFRKSEGLEDPYYQLELSGIGVLDKNFTLDYFKSLINEETEKLSLKAFLATKQRILGVGNGVVQDVLFQARMHPKRKLITLKEEERETLYHALVTTIEKMSAQGGRNTERDLFGEEGGYQTILSNKTVGAVCPVCGGPITKENYLGGSIYYCWGCQK